jgi:hypothetical protein
VGVRIEPTTLMFYGLGTRELLRTRANALTPSRSCGYGVCDQPVHRHARRSCRSACSAGPVRRVAHPQTAQPQTATASQRYKRHDKRWKRYEKQRPGHHVQIDVKFIEPIAGAAGRRGGRNTYYKFTAIDYFTRLRVLRIGPAPARPGRREGLSRGRLRRSRADLLPLRRHSAASGRVTVEFERHVKYADST